MATNLKNIKSRKNDTEWCDAVIKSVSALKKDGFRFETYEDLKNEKQLDNALKKYGKGIDFTDVLMILDETLSFSGKKGFILTSDAIYSSHCDPIAYENLVSVKADIVKSTIILEYADGTVRSEKVGLCADEVCDALQEIIRLQNSPAPKGKQQDAKTEKVHQTEKTAKAKQSKSVSERKRTPPAETKKNEQKRAENDLAAYIRQVTST